MLFAKIKQLLQCVCSQLASDIGLAKVRQRIMKQNTAKRRIGSAVNIIKWFKLENFLCVYCVGVSDQNINFSCRELPGTAC